MAAPHREPFDRLLTAQGIIDDLSIISADTKLATLDPKLIW